MITISKTKKKSGESNPYSQIEVLLAMSIKGDEKAFKAIYDLLAGKMYSLCIRYAGNAHDANDFFQEGIIRVYKNLSSYKGSGSFEGWARRIFVNTCLDLLKSKQKVSFEDISENLNISNDEWQGLDRLSQSELFQLIQELPHGYRTIVNLYLIEEFSHKEIAGMLGIAEGTSKSQLSRAKTILQKSILDINGR